MDEDFWPKACGGPHLVTAMVGVAVWLAELIFAKYVEPFGIEEGRLKLFYCLAYLKRYPLARQLCTLTPRNVHPGPCVSTIGRWITFMMRHLFAVMVEVSAVHFDHPNNHTPHFPQDVLGSWDTFPIFCKAASNTYQPKYKHHVVKFQGIINHLGFFCFVSGPHPGAMSDTTLARLYRPHFQPHWTILGDLAYLSVPNCLTPFKNQGACPEQGLAQSLTPDELEFNRVHQFYRARVAHAFGRLHAWKIVDDVYRGSDLTPLRQAVHIICNIRNMYMAFNIPYQPYTPCAQG
jgi:hypothetical protein